jgi:hypothetical protein
LPRTHAPASCIACCCNPPSPHLPPSPPLPPTLAAAAQPRKQPAAPPPLQLTPAKADLAKCSPPLPPPPPLSPSPLQLSRANHSNAAATRFAHFFTLVVREATEMISRMELAANDSIILEYGGQRKFPLLFSRCVYGQPESCSRLENHREGNMSRLHLQHAAFGGRLLQVYIVHKQARVTCDTCVCHVTRCRRCSACPSKRCLRGARGVVTPL